MNKQGEGCPWVFYVNEIVRRVFEVNVSMWEISGVNKQKIQK